MIMMPPVPGIFGSDEEEEDKSGIDVNSYETCKFRLTENTKCGARIFKGAGMCYPHRNMFCRTCGSRATHLCFENSKCNARLCDNQYCISTHNQKTGHVSNVWNMSYME